MSLGAWQHDSYLFQLLCRAEQKASRHPDWKLIRNYFLIERPNLASKTRETIDADFTGMFDPLMEFADAFAEVKSRLGAESRESKSAATLSSQEQLANWRAQMTMEKRRSLALEAVRAAQCENLLGAGEAKELAIEHLFENVSVVRELHAAAMLPRRGIGRVSIDEAFQFARCDSRFTGAGNDLITTREVLAEESALLAAVQAERGRDAINYRAGQVVEFHRRARGGFKSGEKWEAIACDGKGVTVSRAAKQGFWPLAQVKSFELYERREIALAAG